MTSIDANRNTAADAARRAQQTQQTQQTQQQQTQQTPQADGVEQAAATRDAVATASVDNERAKEASAVTGAQTKEATPALPADAATTSTTTGPQNAVDATATATTTAGKAAIIDAIAKKAGVELKSGANTNQFLTMARNDVPLVQHALNQATPEERAAGIADPTNPGGTVKVSADDEKAIAGAKDLPSERGVPSLKVAENHVTDRFLDRASGSPEARAKLDEAWAKMSPAERAEVVAAGKAADDKENAPGFTSGFVDGVKDSVTGVVDTAAFAAKLATDPAAREKFEKDASTVSEALKTEEGRTAVRKALGDQADAFFAKGPAYVSGYIAGTVAAGAATGGASAVATKTAAQGLKLVAPEVVAAARTALDASKEIAKKAALPAALATGGLLATSTEAQAAVADVANLAANAPAATAAAAALGAASFKLGAAKEKFGELVHSLVKRGDKEGAARLVDDVRNAINHGTPSSVIEAASTSKKVAELGDKAGGTVARDLDLALRLGDPAAAKAATAALEKKGIPVDAAMKKRLDDTAKRERPEGTFFGDISAARAAATKDFDAGHLRTMSKGKLFDAEGKYNGVRTADGRELRVDWDPNKGLHYNVTGPGGSPTTAYVVRGSPQETYKQYLNELKRLER